MAAALAQADKPWRSYEVYQPEISRYYVADPAFLNVKYNDHSCVIWFKGNWYCFWTGRTTLKSPPLLYLSESQDARKWSMPSACFVDEQMCSNPVEFPQARPVAAEYNGQLWVFWSGSDFKTGKNNSLYVSKLQAPGEKWDNQQMFFEGKPLPFVKENEYSVELTANPIVFKNNRIIIPAVLTSVAGDKSKIACTVYSDDGGHSWQVSNEGVDFDPSIERIEAAVWQEYQTNDSLSMVISCGKIPLMKQYDSIPADAAAFYWASSRDQGQNWSLPEKVLMDSISSGMSVAVPYEYAERPLADDRAIMIFNDSKYDNMTLLRDHSGLAMFFNRGGGIDFAAGNHIAVEETFTSNPYIAVRGQRLIVSYTKGVQEAGIKVAHILDVPRRDKSYIYPRTVRFKDTQRPHLTKEGYYHFQGDQYIKTQNAVNIDENGFSGALWFRGDFEGLIFDCRKDDGTAGFRWFIDENKVKLQLPGVEPFVAKEINQEFIYWTYLGFTVDALQGKIDFYLNGTLIETQQYGKDKLKRLSGDIGYVGYKEGDEGLSGDIEFLGFYNEMLTQAQHLHLYNGFAGQLRLPYLRGESAPPQKPVLELDPQKASQGDTVKGFVYPQDSKGGTVELETIAGRNLMRFNGQASAGLDVDTNDRRYGGHLQVEFAFMIESKEQMVLCTVGDTMSPVRIVSRDNCLYLSLSGNEQLIGEVQPDRWHTIVIFSGGTITRAKLGNNRFRQISHTPQATWFYLGQAFKDDEFNPQTSFVIDISTVRTRIIRQ